MKQNTWFKQPGPDSVPTMMQRMTSSLPSLVHKILDKTIWVLSTGRNAVVVIVCLFVAQSFDPVIGEQCDEIWCPL